jgi:hypothetical protein
MPSRPPDPEPIRSPSRPPGNGRDVTDFHPGCHVRDTASIGLGNACIPCPTTVSGLFSPPLSAPSASKKWKARKQTSHGIWMRVGPPGYGGYRGNRFPEKSSPLGYNPHNTPFSKDPFGETNSNSARINMRHYKTWIDYSIALYEKELYTPWAFTAGTLGPEEIARIQTAFQSLIDQNDEEILLYIDPQVPGDRSYSIVLTNKQLLWKPFREDPCSNPIKDMCQCRYQPNDSKYLITFGISKIRVILPESIVRAFCNIVSNIGEEEVIREILKTLHDDETVEKIIYGEGGYSSGVIMCTNHRVILCKNIFSLHGPTTREIKDLEWKSIKDISIDYGRPPLGPFGLIIIDGENDKISIQTQFYLLELVKNQLVSLLLKKTRRESLGHA